MLQNSLIYNFELILPKLWQHIELSLISILLAMLVGIPLGIWIVYKPRWQTIILGITSALQTIPSLALLAFLIPFLGIGVKPTLVALTLYALLPIVRNTFIGIKEISPDLLQAADGLGFTPHQRLFKVELPLATPVIIAGVRTAAALTIGIATIAAFIGAGGLGDFIAEGLALSNNSLILMGAIPAALLALLVDFLIGQIENHFNWKTRKNKIPRKLFISLVLALLLIPLCFAFFTKISSTHKDDTIIIASKNFTEQYILADMMAELIQKHTNLKVIKKLNLGTTAIIQAALQNKEVDLYPEYTGTAYMIVLNQTQILSAAQTYQYVSQAYERQFNLKWLGFFGFNNSETLATTQSFASQHHINTLSQLSRLAPQLTIAAPAEFIRRSDGLQGLEKTYGLKFKKVLQMQPDLMYEALRRGNVDVILAFTTDGRLLAYKLKPLEDDQHFYPPYDAAPVIRIAVLNKYPKLITVLKLLNGKIDNKTMQQLNYKVNILHQTPDQVAHQFLIEHRLIKTPSRSALHTTINSTYFD